MTSRVGASYENKTGIKSQLEMTGANVEIATSDGMLPIDWIIRLIVTFVLNRL
jgi:hypothetical protein